MAGLGRRARSRHVAQQLLAALASLQIASAAEPSNHAAVEAGQRIYRDGVLISGAPLIGAQAGGVQARGAAAACVNCHRRSGLGTTEGRIVAPPITPRYLFPAVMVGRAAGTSPRERRRTPFTDETLAATIRSGLGRDGRPLNPLMPRFALGESDMASLIAYLRSLPSLPDPGVTEDTVHFATVITPDVDAQDRAAFLEVMQAFVDDKNAFVRGGRRTLRAVGQVDYRITRRWALHVWNLEGPPADWAAQLRAHLSTYPVFALLSGLGANHWQPVARFCEEAQLPCLFPNVPAPGAADDDFYSIYLSAGVLLEAHLAARALQAESGRVVQLYRAGSPGAQAARELTASLEAGRTRDVALAPAQSAADVLAGVLPGDTLVLWLSASDSRQLPAKPPPGVRIYVSGLLGGLDDPSVPPGWRPAVLETYPIDLPDRRAVRMALPLNWMRIRKLHMIKPKLQVDTWLACGIVAEALTDMMDNFQRDFLVERIETMLSHRQLTAWYPHLSLGPRQRLASKGGYLVHLGRDGQVIPEGDWVVP